MKQLFCISIVIGLAWTVNQTEQGHFSTPDKFKSLKEAFWRIEGMVCEKAETFPSKKLVSFLKEKEGFRSTTYICAGGKKPIGYGFTSDDICEAIQRGYLPKGYQFPGYMTEQEAENFLIHISLPVYNEIVEEKVKVNLTPNQKEALISFTYNLGGKPLEKIAGQLNEGDYNVTGRMKKYVFAGGQVRQGLVIRRNEEAMMFLNNYENTATKQ